MKDGVKDVVAEGVKGVAKKGAEAVKNGADAAKQMRLGSSSSARKRASRVAGPSW